MAGADMGPMKGKKSSGLMALVIADGKKKSSEKKTEVDSPVAYGSDRQKSFTAKMLKDGTYLLNWTSPDSYNNEGTAPDCEAAAKAMEAYFKGQSDESEAE